MKIASLVLAIMFMLAGASVQAQKKSAQGRLGRPIIQPQLVVIQDDNGGGFLLFDPASGSYKSSLCEYGYVFSGRGQVKVDGCNVYFSDIQTGYRIFASVNMCEHQGKCAFEIFELPKVDFEIEPILESWADSDMRNSTTECVVLVSPK